MALAGIAVLLVYVIPQNLVFGGLLLLFFAGFFVYGPQACFWPLSPDLLGVNRSGTGVGVMNTFAYAFAGGGEPLIGYLVDQTGQENIVFVLTAFICFLSALMVLFVRR